MSDFTQYATSEFESGNVLEVIDDMTSESFSVVIKDNGLYKPDVLFTAVNNDAIRSMQAEIEYTSEIVGVSVDEFLESMPMIKELLSK